MKKHSKPADKKSKQQVGNKNIGKQQKNSFIQNIVKSSLPHAGILLIFLALSFIYFSPILEGKILPQSDDIHAEGVAKELIDFEKNNPGEESWWTNSVFGGMPAYQIKGGGTSYNIYLSIQRLLRFHLPYTTVSIVFLYLFGFYILLVSLKIDKWLSMAGAIAFAFASYNIIIIAAGHITKCYAIGYMAPAIAGILFTYNKPKDKSNKVIHYLLGGMFTALTIGLQISTSHVQITYYLMLMIGILVVSKLVYAILEKQINHFLLATAVVVVAGILAAVPNISGLLVTYEYGEYTIRGKSELTDVSKTANIGEIENKNTNDGLDPNYAFAWSYGTGETFSLMIPDIKGGGSGAIGNHEKAMKAIDPQFKEMIANQNQYWGAQPFTVGPVYVGAIICFLFILGLFFVEGHQKWWLLAATILSILLALGKNFLPFAELFFYNVPLYNKFRTVAMALVIAGVTMPLLGLLAVQKILKNPTIIKEKKVEFLIAFGLTGVITLLFYAIPDTFFDFMNAQELAGIEQQKGQILSDVNIAQEMKAQYMEQFKAFVTNIEIARITIFRSDAIRSFIFILLSAGILALPAFLKVNKNIIIVGLAILLLADMWTVAKRYLNDDQFVSKSQSKNHFVASAADKIILKDIDPNYRVLNLTRDPFKDAYTPYFHKSIGGYHGAKLRRYQDLIDRQLGYNIQMINRAVKDTSIKRSLADILSEQHILNMLNTKYIIYDPNAMPIVNMNSLGSAWFVKEYELVKNADEEIAALNYLKPAKKAIINEQFADKIPKMNTEDYFGQDSAIIKLTDYKPNHLTYKTKTPKQRLAIFSEIYYDKGWNAYIDGKPADYFRANYILRSMVVPKGLHTIEFKFEPSTYYLGKKIGIASSLLALLLFLGIIGKIVINERNKKKSKPNKNFESITI